MTTLVTGGAGFVGSAVVRHLSQRDDVVVLDLAERGSASGTLVNVQSIQGDVRDRVLLERTCREARVGSVVHLAAPLSAECAADPAAALGMARAMVNVLELCRAGIVRKVVWSSTIAVYGPARPEELTDEASPRAPETLYASAKAFSEDLGQHYRAAWNVDCVALRMPFVFGAGQERSGGSWISRICEDVALGRPTTAKSGEGRLSLLYVDDAADAVVTALQKDRVPVPVVLLRGHEISVANFVEQVRALAPGARITVEPGPQTLPTRLDGSLAERVLGWRPRTSIAEGVLTIFDAARGASAV